MHIVNSLSKSLDFDTNPKDLMSENPDGNMGGGCFRNVTFKHSDHSYPEDLLQNSRFSGTSLAARIAGRRDVTVSSLGTELGSST